MNTLIDNLGALSNAPGISGNEIAVRRVLRPILEPHVDEISVDAIGNLMTHKAGTGASPLRVLVTAHMDEVGLMVVGHTGDGTLRVETAGGVPARILPGLTVRVGDDGLPGVIGIQAIHRANHGSLERVPQISQMAVDIGAKDKSEAEKLAPLGTSVVFTTEFQEIGGTCLGKAFDDRAGCAALAALLQGDPFPFDLYGVFTVQEEVGLRGAGVAAYAVEPDVGVALEGTLADDLPKEEEDVSPTTALGKGPAITVMDRSYVTPPRLLSHFIRSAEEDGLAYQLKQPGIGGTDAGSIHRARAGVPTITVAAPCRYIHSPVSMLRRRDLETLVQLVDGALRKLTPDMGQGTTAR